MLVERDVRVRAALRMLFSHEPGMAIVVESPNAQALAKRVAEHKPDFVLFDWELAEGHGHQILSSLRELEPKLQIVVLSCHSESESLAIQAGADVFVSKTDPPDTLLGAIRALIKMEVKQKEEAL
jgi:DNA-binding NarL/FixJ family response regulator